MKEKTILSMVTWNRLEILKKCLNSVFERTKTPYKILIVDNGSNDGTVEYLKKLKEEKGDLIDLILLKENHGISQARNMHWIKCKNHDVIRFDDDAEILTDNWIDILKKASDENNAVIGLEHESLAHIPDYKENGLADTGEVCGGVYFLPKNCVNKLSGWCEDYGKYGYEDIDYTQRARIGGFKLFYSNLVRWNHLVPIVAGRAPGEYMKVYHDNLTAYGEGKKLL